MTQRSSRVLLSFLTLLLSATLFPAFASAATPTVSVSAALTTVPVNSTTVISWSSSNASSCTSSTGLGGTGTSGSFTTPPLSQSTAFAVTCVGAGGSASGSTAVSVTTAPIVYVTASNIVVPYGATTTIRWSSVGATGCTATNNTGGKGPSGSFTTSPITTTTIFTVNCTNGTSYGSASVTVSVGPTQAGPALPSTLTLSNLPPTNTTQGTASIGYTLIGSGTVYCRRDSYAPIVCPNPFQLGMTTPLTVGTHSVDFYIDWGSGVSAASVPDKSYRWVIGASTVSAPTPISTKFTIGARISVTTGPINVRDAAYRNILGTQPTGAQGTIVGGPTLANGVIWWQVNYDSGLDGWSYEGYISAAANIPVTLSLSNLPQLSTTQTSASISYALSGSGTVYCRRDGYDPIACPNPWSLGATTPLTAGTHIVDFYIDKGTGVTTASVPDKSYSWNITGTTATSPPPPLAPSPTPVSSGVTPLSALPVVGVEAGGYDFSGVANNNPPTVTGSIAGPNMNDGIVRYQKLTNVLGTGKVGHLFRTKNGDDSGGWSGVRSELSWYGYTPSVHYATDYWEALAWNPISGEWWGTDPSPDPGDTWDIIWQIHADGLGSPPLSIEQINNSAGTYNDGENGTTRGLNTHGLYLSALQLDSNVTPKFPLGTTLNATTPVGLTNGVWTKFIIHYRLGNSLADNPIIEVWRDGVKVLEKTGSDAFTGDSTGGSVFGPNMPLKNGIYRPTDGWGGMNTRAVYASEHYFGQGTNLYAEADAALLGFGGTSISPTPTPTSVTHFALGARVQVPSGPLNVRDAACGNILGTQQTGALGIIVGGPTLANGVYWVQVNYDSGLDGWSSESLLALAPAATPALSPISTAFSMNQRVTANTGPLNVRDAAYGNILGTQPMGALGTIVGGPVSANGVIWWQVNYDSGLDGWSYEGYLSAGGAVAPTLALSNLPPTSTTQTSASIGYSLTGSTATVYCRRDGYDPGVCPNPFVLGATAPLAAGTHTVDFYIDKGQGVSAASVPEKSYSWTIMGAASASPTPTPSTTSCSSGVTPLAQVPYSEASPGIDGSPQTDGPYDGITPKIWNGNVILGPVLDPNGSGRTVNIHRIMEAAPAAWRTTHRSELHYNSDFPPGVDTWQAFAVMRKPGESFPVSQSDSMLVLQSHTPESGDTGPPYALVLDPTTNTVKWDISWNANPPSTWNYVGGPNPDRYDVRPSPGSETMMPEGVWYRYILHYRAGYLSSHNPITEVWRAKPGGNYEKLFTYTGLNAYNGGNGYSRMGPYKWDADWGGQGSLAFYETPLYYGRGANLFDQAAAALCGL